MRSSNSLLNLVRAPSARSTCASPSTARRTASPRAAASLGASLPALSAGGGVEEAGESGREECRGFDIGEMSGGELLVLGVRDPVRERPHGTGGDNRVVPPGDDQRGRANCRNQCVEIGVA